MSDNGRLADDELVAVQGGIRLAKVTAKAWRGLVATVLRDTGVRLLITAPYGGYRSIADQWAMTRDKSTSTTGQVAGVGYSVHGYGTCVDINNWETLGLARLDPYAHRYGFTRTITSERWHYQHDGRTTDMDLLDTIPAHTNPDDFAKVAGQTYLRDYFAADNWRGIRVQRDLDRLAKKVDTISTPKIDPAALAAALKDPTVVAAIAKAVNDDAARRLRE